MQAKAIKSINPCGHDFSIEVREVADGLQAVEAVAAAATSDEPFDAIFMDSVMPVKGV